MRQIERARALARASAWLRALMGTWLLAGAASATGGDLATAVERALGDAYTEAVWQVGTPFEGVPAAWQAPNREHGYRTYFLEDGVRLVPRSEGQAWTFGMRLGAIRRGEQLLVPPAPQVEARGARVEYRREGLVEWYWNAPDGLEQGFDIARRPLAEAGPGPLVLELELGGDLALERVLPSVGAIVSRGDADGPRLSISKLHAFDARGRSLPCHFEGRGTRLALVVDDRDARYPIVVDPTIQNEAAKLRVEGAPHGTDFGFALDLSGEYALVGAPGDVPSAGSAYIFRRSGAAWELDAKLGPASTRLGDRFGHGVAIDASFALVGAPGDDGGAEDGGAVHVYRNQNGTWVPAQVLRAPLPEAGAGFGASVGLGAGWLAVGAPHEDAAGQDSGAVHLFRLLGNQWTYSQRLLPGGLGAGASLGSALDFSGARLALGAPGGAGRVYLYENDAPGIWSPRTSIADPDAAEFGAALDLVGGALLVGAPATGLGNLPERGLAALYELVGENLERRWLVLGSNPWERLGQAVSLDRALDATWKALIGVPGKHGPAPGCGAVLTRHSPDGATWYTGPLLFAAGAGEEENLGGVLALQGDTALAGLPRREAGGMRPGGVLRWAWTGGAWNEMESWNALDRGAGDRLGFALALEGDLALVGAPGESDTVPGAGAAYLFERVDGVWLQRVRLTAGILAQPGAELGSAVAIAPGGGRLLLGAPFEHGNAPRSGAAYLFEEVAPGLWKRRQRLLPWDGGQNAWFGASVALGEGIAVVGAWYAAGAAPQSGAAYVFSEGDSGWLADAKLFSGSGQHGDTFGSALWTDGQELLVGAPRAASVGEHAGSIEVFRSVLGGWAHQQTLTPDSPGAFLGMSLAVEGPLLFAGAPGTHGQRGAVERFRREGVQWLHEERVTPTERTPGERFGEAVGASGGRLVVGAPVRHLFGPRSGAAYALDPGPLGWRTTSLLPSDGAAGARIGAAVAIAGRTALVGAPDLADGAPAVGAAYAFELEPVGPVVPYGFGDGEHGPCWCYGNSPAGSGEGCRNSAGSGAILSAFGSTSVAADDLGFAVTQLPPGEPGLLFMGTQALPGLSLGDGLLFAGGGVVRLGARVSDALGRAEWTALAALGEWQAGDVRYFQVWYRDTKLSICSVHTNLSSALQVTFSP